MSTKWNAMIHTSKLFISFFWVDFPITNKKYFWQKKKKIVIVIDVPFQQSIIRSVPLQLEWHKTKLHQEKLVMETAKLGKSLWNMAERFWEAHHKSATETLSLTLQIRVSSSLTSENAVLWLDREGNGILSHLWENEKTYSRQGKG